MPFLDVLLCTPHAHSVPETGIQQTLSTSEKKRMVEIWLWSLCLGKSVPLVRRQLNLTRDKLNQISFKVKENIKAPFYDWLVTCKNISAGGSKNIGLVKSQASILEEFPVGKNIREKSSLRWDQRSC